MTPQLPAGYSVVEDTEQTPPAPQGSSAPALPKGYSLVDEPKEQSIANFAKGLATEVAVGGAGQVVGAMTGPGYFIIAPASGAYGNYLKQQQEIERGERNQLSVGEMVASALINTIPGGVATKVGAKVLKAPTAAIGRTVGERAARIGEQAVIRGTEGAVVGAGAKTVETAIEDKRWPTYDEYLNVIKSGAAFGGAVGAGEKVLAPTLSKTASKIWNRFSGKTQQEVSQELTTIRNTGNPEERQAAGEIIDEVGQRMGLVNPRPKSAQESAAQLATAVEPPTTGSAERSARALLGEEAVEIEELRKIAEQRDSMLSQKAEVQSSRRKAIQQLEMAQNQRIAEQKAAEMAKYQPISQAEKSAAVFEQAFTEGKTQAGSEGLRARLAAEQQAAEIAQKQVPIPPAQQSASVFERAFEEGRTQAGAQGLRARLGGEKQAGIRAEDFERARSLEDIARQIEAGRLSAPERIPSEAILRATMVKPAGKIGRSMKTDMPTTEDIIQEFQNVPGVKGRAGAIKMGLVGSAAAASLGAAESMGEEGGAKLKAPVDAYEIVHPDSRIGTLKYDGKKWNEDSILQDINKKEMELVKIDVAAPSLMIREEWQKIQDSRDRGEITELDAQKKQFDLMRDIPIKDIGMATAARIGFPLLGEGLTAKRAGGLGRVPGAMIGEAVGSMIEGMPVTAGGVLGAGVAALPGGVQGQFAKNVLKFAGAQIGGEMTKEAIRGDLISFKRAAMAAAEGGAGAVGMKLMDKAARAVSSQVAKRGDWAVIKTLSGANELDLITDPTIYRDSWPNSIMMKLAGGSNKFQETVSRINYPRMTEVVEGILGVPAKTSFDRPFFITMRKKLGEPYEKIAAVSKQARSAVDDWKAANESISVNSKAAASETNPKVRIQYREAAAKAREDADKAFAVIQTEAYATGKGNLIDDLVQSRKQLARMYAIKASVNEASGKIEYPGAWGEMYEAGARFDGNLEKLARLAAIMPEVLQPPQNIIRKNPIKGLSDTRMIDSVSKMMSLPIKGALAGPQAAALQTMMSPAYQRGQIMPSSFTQPPVPAQLGRFLGTETLEATRPIPYR